MGFLSGLKKVKRYIKLPDGYKLLSFWTSSQSVEMDDGSTLESNKPNWDDKYTRSEVDNKLSAIETNIDWKESVDTFTDISTAYPDPQDGWTVNVRDTDYTYRYSGEEWVAISANAIPKATQSIDGLLTKEDKTSYDSAVEKKHEHDNKSALDMITSEKIAGWNELSQNSVTGVKGNKEETYRTGNVNITAADIGAVDKSGDTMTGTLTAPTFSGNLEGTFHGISDNQFFRAGANYGFNNGLSEDTTTWTTPGCFGVWGDCTGTPKETPWGNLLVFPSMTEQARILQIYYDWNDPDKVYHRVINGTTASNWIIFASGSELDTHINNGNIHFTASERQQLGSLVSQFGSKANAVAPLGCNTLPSNLISKMTAGSFSYNSDNGYLNLYQYTSDNINSTYLQSDASQGWKIMVTGYYHLYIRAYMLTCSDAARVKRLGIRINNDHPIFDMKRANTYEMMGDSGIVYLTKGTIIYPQFQMDANGNTKTTATVSGVITVLPLFVNYN